MPNRPLHPCNAPSRCPVLIPAVQRLCLARQRQANREYNQHQRPARHAFYQTPAWRRLSKQGLGEQPGVPAEPGLPRPTTSSASRSGPTWGWCAVTLSVGVAHVTAGGRPRNMEGGRKEKADGNLIRRRIANNSAVLVRDSSPHARIFGPNENTVNRSVLTTRS